MSEQVIRSIQIRETEQTEIPHWLLSRCPHKPKWLSTKSSLLYFSKPSHATCSYKRHSKLFEILKSAQQSQSWLLAIQFLYSSHNTPSSDLTSNPESSVHISWRATYFLEMFKNQNTIHVSVRHLSPVYPTACAWIDLIEYLHATFLPTTYSVTYSWILLHWVHRDIKIRSLRSITSHAGLLFKENPAFPSQSKPKSDQTI